MHFLSEIFFQGTSLISETETRSNIHKISGSISLYHCFQLNIGNMKQCDRRENQFHEDCVNFSNEDRQKQLMKKDSGSVDVIRDS